MPHDGRGGRRGHLLGGRRLYLSYYTNVASGAAIVLVATGLFVVVYVGAPRQGLLRAA